MTPEQRARYAGTAAEGRKDADLFYQRVVAAGGEPLVWVIDAEEGINTKTSVRAMCTQLRGHVPGEAVWFYSFDSKCRSWADLMAIFDGVWTARWNTPEIAPGYKDYALWQFGYTSVPGSARPPTPAVCTRKRRWRRCWRAGLLDTEYGQAGVMPMQQFVETSGKLAGAISAVIALVGLVLIKPILTMRKKRLAKARDEQEFREKVLAGLDGIKDDVGDLQCDRLNQAHDYYMDKGYCPTERKGVLCNMYQSYHSKGRNHLSAHYEEDIVSLPDHL